MATLIMGLSLCLMLVVSSAALPRDWIEEPGPRVKATQGAVWPKPQQQTVEKLALVVRPSTFLFVNEGMECPILEEALVRYKGIMLRSLPRTYRNDLKSTRKYRKINRNANRAYLNSLRVNLTCCCDSPLDSNMDETYDLNVSKEQGKSILTAKSIWGILRGLESFSQLLYTEPFEHILLVNVTTIHDYPRFSHRGLLLDTSRHFMPIHKIMQILDAMSYNKMNVFHWHIVDDQSFPYESYTFPELSERAAYHPFMVYTQQDIARIIEYAKNLGIRVMPEFDSPGHTRSWGVSHPEILTQCYKNGRPDGTLGPIDPTLNSTYTFFRKLFAEVIKVFPDKYLHLGGDEVGFNCWQSNPDLNARMQAMGIPDLWKLLDVYMQRLLDMTAEMDASALVWQEVFDNGVRLPNGTIVHIWTGDHKAKLQQVTAAGLPALLSTCWYLDHLSNGGDWTKFYNCEPWEFSNDPKQRNLVLGGEACMWAEVIDESNVLQRIWPRASAVAEKLWSKMNADSTTEAAKRLEEHSCRMNLRGIPAQPPNGPGFCLY